MAKARQRKRARSSARRGPCAPTWAKLKNEELLDVRLCDLDLKIEGTGLEERIERLWGELERRGLFFRPYFWLSTDWFTPDGLPGIAVPFYLAHPRLVRLEEEQMLDVEGGAAEWCMRLLRHETGHAISNAYRLHRLRRWQQVFGKAGDPYPEHYQPRPYSKRFVLHLDCWYAQSHPSEDFAETFAVWMTPRFPWRKRYAGWPALKKLEFVNELMHEVGHRKPPVRSREQVEPIRLNRVTLREYYEKKHTRYAIDYSNFYDRDLRRLFSDQSEHAKKESGAVFLRRIRPDLRRSVARWTGEYQYTIDQVLGEMIERCRTLKLRVHQSQRRTKLDATLLLTVATMNYLHSGNHRMLR